MAPLRQGSSHTVSLVSLCVFLNKGVHQLEWRVNPLNLNVQQTLQPTKKERKLKEINEKYVLNQRLLILWSAYGVRGTN